MKDVYKRQVLAGGVAMFNNYKKLHEMEQVVASADPGAVIREARGGVYPSEGEKKIRESAMEVLPETMVPDCLLYTSRCV